MATFSYVTTFADGGEPFFSGIVDLDLVWVNGQAMLYAASGPDGGMTAYQVDDTSATFLDQVSYGAGSFASAPVQVELLDLDGSNMLVPLGQSALGMTGYELDRAGQFMDTASLATGTGLTDYPCAVATYTIGAQTYVFGARAGGDAIHSYALQGDGTLLEQTPALTGSAFQGVAIPDMATVTVAGAPILLAVSAVESQLKSFAINSDGSLTNLSHIGATEGLGMDTPTAVVTAEIGGHSYAVIAGAGSSSLSVVEVTSDGLLLPIDHIIDDLGTRFMSIQTLDIATINGRVYIVAGGADDGLSLFELLPGGQLLGMASVEDMLTTSLANVQALALGTTSNGLQVFAASETDPGISQFTVNLGTVTAPVIGNSTSQTLTGTSYGDLILGAAGNDTINGQGGDDVLIDGAGSDRLTGGAGADTFVMTKDSDVDYILDFEAGKDRLDLSGFDMFYGVDQLDIISTSTGAQLRYRDNIIVVTSATGMSLNAAHFAATGVISVTRPPLLAVEAGRNVAGTSGNDTQTGATGHDTLLGSPGADHLDGLGGNDLVDYSASSGAVIVSLFGGGPGQGGDAEGDTYSGIENLTGSNFDDRLAGDAQDNGLFGGAGQDTMHGHAGNDTLDGGDGNDRLSGSDGDDEVEGGNGADTIHGANGADTLSGGDWNDFVYGGQGSDSLDGGAGDDRLTGGTQNDILDGGAGNDYLIGHIGDDLLRGGDGNDTLSGGYFSDTLEGGDGDDRLHGHFGSDRLDGGAGNDTLFGGADADEFMFRDGYGRDRIQDFDPSRDILLIDHNLWGGGLSVTQMLDTYAQDFHGNLSLIFGGGDQLTLAGITDADDIAGMLVIF